MCTHPGQTANPACESPLAPQLRSIRAGTDQGIRHADITRFA